MSNEYDIEKYDREREERIKHLETLKEQAEEEFNSYHNDKRENYERIEKERSSAKKKLIGIASVALLGIAGYVGYSSLSGSSSSNENRAVEKKGGAENPDVRNQIASIVSTAMKKDDDREKSGAVDVSKMVASKSQESQRGGNENRTEDLDDIALANANINNNSIENRTEERATTSRSSIVKEHTTAPKTHTKEVTKKTTHKPKIYKIIKVREGDTLASIAERYYGNPMYYRPIARANHIWKSTRLRVGQKLIIPQLDEKIRKRLYRIRRGDTLRKISKRFYGTANKVQKIVDANYKIKSAKSKLNVGDIIYIPK